MVDVARLQVEVDSRQVKKAEDNLNRFGRTSSKAQQSSKRFGNQAQRTAKAMQGMNRSVKLLTGAMGALTAALSIRALQQFVTSSVAAVDQIGKMADTAGVTSENLQELRFAFGQLAGTTDRELDASLRRFNRRLGLAADGGGAAKGVFEDLNIALSNTSGEARDSEVILNELFVELAGIEDASRRAALASQAFGEDAGPRLAAALGNGIDSLSAAKQEARDLGFVLSDETVASGEQMADEFDKLSRQLSTQFQKAVIENKDAILGLVDGFTDLLNAASRGDVLPDFFSRAEEGTSGFVQELEKAARIILALTGAKFGAGAGRVGGPLAMIGGAITGGTAGFFSPEIAGQLQNALGEGDGGAGGQNQLQRVEGPQQLPNVDLTTETREYNRLLDLVQGKTRGVIEKTSVWENTLKDVQGVMEDDLSDSITDVIMQVDSLSDAFSSLAKQIARTIIQRQVADPLADLAIQGIGSIFGGQTQTGTNPGRPGGGAGVRGLANGGNTFSNTPVMVGERGPEMFVPGQDGRIIPNHQMGGGGDVTVNIINQGGEQLQSEKQEQRRGPNGDMTIDVMVKSSMDRLDSQGQLDGIFRRHGAQRQGQF